MAKIQTMLAVITAILAVSAFAFISPLSRSQAAATNGSGALSPIPAPASCTYAGHPTNPLSQTTIAVNGTSTFTKHVEKEIYDCIISGSTKHYILDTTTWTSMTEQFVQQLDGSVAVFSNQFEECAKDRATGTVYSCQTEKVGSSLAPTSDCRQIGLGFPQNMNTVATNLALVKTVESQKELFRCDTPNGAVIQEVIIWTTTSDVIISNIGTYSSYSVETCQKPVTITTGLPLLSCHVQGPTKLIP